MNEGKIKIVSEEIKNIFSKLESTDSDVVNFGLFLVKNELVTDCAKLASFIECDGVAKVLFQLKKSEKTVLISVNILYDILFQISSIDAASFECRRNIIRKMSSLLLETNNHKVLDTLLLVFIDIINNTKLSAGYCQPGLIGRGARVGRLFPRLIKLRSSTMQSVARKADELLWKIFDADSIRPRIAKAATFQALLPIINIEIETGNIGETMFLTMLIELLKADPIEFWLADGIPLLIRLIKETDASFPAVDSLPRPFEKLISRNAEFFTYLHLFGNIDGAMEQLEEYGIHEILTTRIYNSILKNEIHPSYCCEKNIEMVSFQLGFDTHRSRSFIDSPWPVWLSKNGWDKPTDKNNKSFFHQEEEVALDLLIKLFKLKSHGPIADRKLAAAKEQERLRKLFDENTIKIIIAYLTGTPRPSFLACQFLFCLTSRPSFFARHLRNSFPFEVYRYFGSGRAKCCSLHTSLRKVGEQILDQLGEMDSNFANFKMRHMEQVLALNLTPLATSTALAAPLIVRCKESIKRLVMHYRILDTIGIELQSTQSRSNAVIALSSLFKLFEMDDLLCHELSITSDHSSPHSNACKISNVETDVNFVIPRHQHVIHGVKRLLLRSDYFRAMFCGQFMETKLLNVQMNIDIEPSELEVILHLIYGCGKGCGIIRNLEQMMDSDESAIHLLVFMDYFMLFEDIKIVIDLILKQNWIQVPEAFMAFFTKANGISPYALEKLRSHMEFVVFSDTIDIDIRSKIIDMRLTSDDAGDVILKWTRTFYSRII